MLSCGFRNVWRALVKDSGSDAGDEPAPFDYDRLVLPLLGVCGTHVYVGAGIVLGDQGASAQLHRIVAAPATPSSVVLLSCSLPRSRGASCAWSAAGHHAECVAHVDCARPHGVFILHCILLNIAAYIGQQVQAATEARGRWQLASNPAHTRNPTVIRSTVPDDKPIDRHAHAAKADWPADAVPAPVRRLVSANDVLALERVEGLTDVKREPEANAGMLRSSGHWGPRSDKVRGAGGVRWPLVLCVQSVR